MARRQFSEDFWLVIAMMVFILLLALLLAVMG
jgi:hypothetical protein